MQSTSSMAIRLSVLIFTTVISLTGAQAAPAWSNRPSWATSASDAAPVATVPISGASTSKKGKPNLGGVEPFSPGSHNISLHLGQFFLIGDVLGEYSDKIGTQIHYTYGVSDLFAFDSSIGYSNHSKEIIEKDKEGKSITQEREVSMISLLAGMRVNLNWYDKVIPYFSFGMGFYKPNMQVTAASSVSATLFGVHLGPGINLQLSPQMFFGASMNFYDVFNSKINTSAGSVTLGGSYASFLLQAGFTFAGI